MGASGEGGGFCDHDMAPMGFESPVWSVGWDISDPGDFVVRHGKACFLGGREPGSLAV